MIREATFLGLVCLFMIICADAFIGGKYLFKKAQFFRRLALAAAVLVFTIIAKNNPLIIDHLNNELRILSIAVAAIIIAIALFDMIKVIIKSEELNYRRYKRHNRHQGDHRRHASANH